MKRNIICTIIILSSFILGQDSSSGYEKKIKQLSDAIGLTSESNLFSSESFDLLLGKFDSLGIKDEQLKDGFDWGGREAGFEAYIKNNIDTLVSFFVIVEDIVIDKNISTKQNDSLKIVEEIKISRPIQIVNDLSIKKHPIDKTKEDNAIQKTEESDSRKALLSGLRIGGSLVKALIKEASLSNSTSYFESSINVRFPFGINIGPSLTSLGYESSNYSFESSIDTLESYFGNGSGMIIHFDLSKIIKIGGEKVVKEVVLGSQNYNHGSGFMVGYNVNLLLGSLPFSISASSRFNTINFSTGGSSYWGSFHIGMGIDFL